LTRITTIHFMAIQTLKLTASEADFSEAFLAKTEKLKPSVEDYHQFLLENFIQAYSELNLERIKEIGIEIDDWESEFAFQNMAHEFDYLRLPGLKKLFVKEIEPCACARMCNGDTIAFINPVTRRSLVYWVYANEDEVSISKCLWNKSPLNQFQKIYENEHEDGLTPLDFKDFVKY
jgi:hypothetical protein